MELAKTFIGVDEESCLCGIYIPQLTTIRYNEDQNLESEISILTKKGKLLIAA